MHENGQMNELLNQELFRSMARVKLRPLGHIITAFIR